MGTQHHIVPFDRPLANVQAAADAARIHTAAELAAARAAGQQEGGDAARAFSNQQLVELRAEFQTLQSGLLQRLTQAHDSLLGQVRQALPTLTLDLAQRLLAGFVPGPEFVERLCREALDQLYPERDGLELVISPRDAAVLERLVPAWRTHFSNLRVTSDDTLNSGDCLVRSRFGVTDARAAAKLEGLREELLSA
jgi:flagellar assembly protein FliH